MELRQLEYFVAVAQEHGFTRAANRERVAQPAVSAQIRKLERLVGQPLFDRSGRQVRLTQAGAALLPHAQAALSAVRAGQAAVDEVRNLVRGAVAIGTVTLHPVDLARLLADFHADYPSVEITLSADNSDVLLGRLADGSLDAAIVSVGVDHHPAGLALAPITEEAIDAAVPVRHPLCAQAVLSLEQLCQYPLVSLPVGAGLRATFDAACAEVGLHPRVAFEATDPHTVADLARSGLGVAILPRSVARRDKGLHGLRLDPDLRGRLVWAWRSDMTSPAARRFCERAARMAPAGDAPAPSAPG